MRLAEAPLNDRTASFGLNCIGLLAITNLYLHLLYMVTSYSKPKIAQIRFTRNHKPCLQESFRLILQPSAYVLTFVSISKGRSENPELTINVLSEAEW